MEGEEREGGKERMKEDQVFLELKKKKRLGTVRYEDNILHIGKLQTLRS